MTSEDQPEPAERVTPKKPWTAPELEALPMTESELSPPGPGPDGGTGAS